MGHIGCVLLIPQHTIAEIVYRSLVLQHQLLKGLGIAVIFEKENINTINEDSEMMTTIMGAFAQAESESISQNVKWGVRQAMKEGRVYIRYKSLYAYEEDENGEPRLIESQAVVIRRINDEFLAGASLEMIKVGLETDKIPAPNGGASWSIATIRKSRRVGRFTNRAFTM